MEKYFSQFIPCLIVVTIIEFITPENSKQKQIRLAASIMFVIMIFVPVFEYILKSDFSDIFFKTEYEVENIYIKTSAEEQNLNSFYNNRIKEDYENRLYRNLNEYMFTKGFDIKGKYEIIYEDDPGLENFGAIKNITFENGNIFGESDSEKIKKLISDFYMLDIENINIEETSSEVRE